MFPILMFRMIDMDIRNAFAKFESQILRYKQNIEFEILCKVNRTQVLLLVTHLFYWYTVQSNVLSFVKSINHEHVESVNQFVKEKVISYFLL